MYRFICLLTVLISMFLRLPAQEHAVFLGLPLGGNVEEFVEELQDKGYEVRTRSQNIISLTGMFDGVQCIIEVHHTPKSLVVHQVSVAFAEFMENDIARMLKYRQIRKTLKKKYSKWHYTRGKALDEWSSPYARISLGTKRFEGQGFKTLFVWWQDREGWERAKAEGL